MFHAVVPLSYFPSELDKYCVVECKKQLIKKEAIMIKLTNCVISICLIFCWSFAAMATSVDVSPDFYNDHDIAQVQCFLEQEVNEIKNGNAIFGDSYDVHDPSTWVIDKTCVPGYNSMYCNNVGDERPFVFDDDGNLIKVNLLYHWSEEVDGLCADDIRSLPVSGNFVFEGCTHLEEVLCGDSAFSNFIIRNASRDFGGHIDLRVRNVNVAYFPIPNSKKHVAFSSAYPSIAIQGYYADDINSLEVVALKTAADGASFMGWYDRFSNELYSTDCKIDILANEISACNLVAVYDSSEEMPPNVPTVYGDVNGDYKLNTGDAVLILRSIVGLEALTDAQQLLANINEDETINTGDAVAVLRSCTGLD